MAIKPRQRAHRKPPKSPPTPLAPSSIPSQLNPQKHLQHLFTISPKTALLLLKTRHTTPATISRTTPNKIVAQFQTLPGMTKKLAEGYRRPMRRIVWVATQANPEREGKVCRDWTNMGLVRRGVWREDWDDLSGWEVEALLQRHGEGKGKGGLKREIEEVKEGVVKSEEEGRVGRIGVKVE